MKTFGGIRETGPWSLTEQQADRAHFALPHGLVLLCEHPISQLLQSFLVTLSQLRHQVCKFLRGLVT